MLQFLKTTDSISEATDRICREYERPAVNNVDARYQAALRIRCEIDLSGSAEPAPEPSKPEEPAEEPKIETWPPRTIDEHCSGWAEVWLLQALLKCRGYNVLVDGIFGDALTHKVKQYQTEHNLSADGVVGKGTWSSLMERM